MYLRILIERQEFETQKFGKENNFIQHMYSRSKKKEKWIIPYYLQIIT